MSSGPEKGQVAGEPAPLEKLEVLRLQKILEWVLRVGVFMCFVGHGTFGFIGKKGWLAYTDVVYIPQEIAWKLQALIGTFDLTMGISALIFPLRGVLAWGVFWCLWTAFLRPLANQGFSEFFERGGNYGVVLGLLVLVGWRRDFRGQFLERAVPSLNPERAYVLSWVLRICTVFLIAGHGLTGIYELHIKEWTGYFATLGIGPTESLALIHYVGWLEVGLGLLVLGFPVNSLLAFISLWKIGFEGLRLPAGEPIWEFIERGGSYTVPLALIAVNLWRSYLPKKSQTFPEVNEHDMAAT